MSDRDSYQRCYVCGTLNDGGPICSDVCGQIWEASKRRRLNAEHDDDTEDVDDSDSDASEVLHEPEAELIGTDDLVDVDVVQREGDPKDAA